MKNHEYADLFPMMSDHDIEELAQDIKANGQRDPIILFDGKILDGRNRHKACLIAGVDPITTDFAGDDALAFVISHNLHRRHLTETQRAMIAARLAKLKKGDVKTQINGSSIDGPSQTKSRTEAAKDLKVSTASVDRAKKVLENAIPEIQDMADAGEISVNAASKVASLPQEDQKKAAMGGVSGVKQAAKTAQEITKEKPAKIEIIQDFGIQKAATAISILRTISDDDKQLNEAMAKVIEYCKTRTNKNQ
jgi:ParB-like chromosome segregation protein Spo0J